MEKNKEKFKKYAKPCDLAIRLSEDILCAAHGNYEESLIFPIVFEVIFKDLLKEGEKPK